MGLQWLRGAVTAAVLVSGLASGSALAVEPAARDDLIGELKIHAAQWEDMFVDVMRNYDIGYNELIAANPGIDPWVPGSGTRILLPTAHILPDAPRKGVVINLPEMRLYYFDPSGQVITHAIGVGEEGWSTPKGSTRITRKMANPAWYPPASIRAEKPELPSVVPAGPDNPLGTHALYLGWNAYLIHGTNKPDGVGRRVSHGCIRMYPEGIADMYQRIQPGTPVTVVDQPVKLGWRGGELFLEIHHTLEMANLVEAREVVSFPPIADLHDQVRKMAGAEAARVDWAMVDRVAEQRLGVPIRITGPRNQSAAAVPAPVPMMPDLPLANPQADNKSWQYTPIVRWH